jgi:non-homologous end joining protein Ku
MASRSMWKGSISFGLVNIPAKVYLATENREFSFNQLCPNGHRIQYKKWCPMDEKEIGYAEVKKGYQVSKDTYIAIDKKDIENMKLLTYDTIGEGRIILASSEADAVSREISNYTHNDKQPPHTHVSIAQHFLLNLRLM